MPPCKLPTTKEASLHKRSSTSRWVAIAAFAPFTLTVLFGGYGIHQESLSAVALPPGTPRCGMGMLAAIIIAGIGGPIMSVVGGLTGFVASKLWTLCRQG